MFENKLNPVMLVFIGKLLQSAISDGYQYVTVSVIFQHFLHHFLLTKLVTSSERVKISVDLSQIASNEIPASFA